MIGQEQHASEVRPITLNERRSFLQLPLEERRRRLSEQADQLMEAYVHKPSLDERLKWQIGDIVES
jgi:hypothetical protein